MEADHTGSPWSGRALESGVCAARSPRSRKWRWPFPSVATAMVSLSLLDTGGSCAEPTHAVWSDSTSVYYLFQLNP